MERENNIARNCEALKELDLVGAASSLMKAISTPVNAHLQLPHTSLNGGPSQGACPLDETVPGPDNPTTSCVENYSPTKPSAASLLPPTTALSDEPSAVLLLPPTTTTLSDEPSPISLLPLMTVSLLDEPTAPSLSIQSQNGWPDWMKQGWTFLMMRDHGEDWMRLAMDWAELELKYQTLSASSGPSTAGHLFGLPTAGRPQAVAWWLGWGHKHIEDEVLVGDINAYSSAWWSWWGGDQSSVVDQRPKWATNCWWAWRLGPPVSPWP